MARPSLENFSMKTKCSRLISCLLPGYGFLLLAHGHQERIMS